MRSAVTCTALHYLDAIGTGSSQAGASILFAAAAFLCGMPSGTPGTVCHCGQRMWLSLGLAALQLLLHPYCERSPAT